MPAEHDGPQLNLLLAGMDGLPIAAALKAGDDGVPFYALILALAHGAMLVTPNPLGARSPYP